MDEDWTRTTFFTGSDLHWDKTIFKTDGRQDNFYNQVIYGFVPKMWSMDFIF